MGRTLLSASLAAVLAVLLTNSTVVTQEPNGGSPLISFRVDDGHAIAVIKVIGSAEKQISDGLSPEPAARYGFRYFDLPPAWQLPGGAAIRQGERWLLHPTPGASIQADTERIVGGQLGCEDAIGVLLRVAPEQSKAFAALPARYFLAERSSAVPSPVTPSTSTVRVLASPSTDEFRTALRATLNELLVRELPRVQADAEPDIARMLTSPVNYHRSWAQRQQTIEESMRRGEGQLTYDIQSFRLAPDGVPVHFVRAEWRVRGRQGFAASVWLRGGLPLEVLETNARPASWLRMFEFQGSVAREHLGLVLNVVDRNGDGWGEVLMAQGGYESMSLSLVEYSASGFHPTGIEYAYGC